MVSYPLLSLGALLLGCFSSARPTHTATTPPMPAASEATLVDAGTLADLVPPAASVEAAPVAVVEATPTCTAVLRGGGHLRRRATAFSEGRVLAAGTTVAVLAVAEGVRRDAARGADDPAVLARVRVVESGAEGWTFVRASELGEACPIVVGSTHQESPDEQATQIADACRRPWSLYTHRGAFRTPSGPLRCGALPEDEVVARVDATGDGQPDSILRLRDVARGCRRAGGEGTFDAVTVLRWRGADGWRAAPISIEGDVNGHGGSERNHVSTSFGGVIRAGAATYLRVDVHGSYQMYTCTDRPPLVRDLLGDTSLSRWHPCGAVLSVLSLPELVAGGCQWNGLTDGSIRVDCARPHRSLLLRWNEALFRLEPEGNTLPTEALERLCHFDWER